MIDRPSRDKLAEALRQYVSGRITNDTLDDIKVDERDNGAVAVKEAVYNDLHEHKAVDGFYIDKKDQRKLIRLDIEEVMDEMYLLYKWMTKEYGYCVEGNKINKELEDGKCSD